MTEFRDKVQGKPNILLLIRLKGECIIGGYTKIGWIERENSDKDAFLYFLKSPHNHESFISNIEQDKEEDAVGYNLFCFFGFGRQSWTLYFDEDRLTMQRILETPNYEDFPSAHGQILAGSEEYRKVGYDQVELEVFQIEM